MIVAAPDCSICYDEQVDGLPKCMPAAAAAALPQLLHAGGAGCGCPLLPLQQPFPQHKRQLQPLVGLTPPPPRLLLPAGRGMQLPGRLPQLQGELPQRHRRQLQLAVCGGCSGGVDQARRCSRPPLQGRKYELPRFVLSDPTNLLPEPGGKVSRRAQPASRRHARCPGHAHPTNPCLPARLPVKRQPANQRAGRHACQHASYRRSAS